MTDRFLLYIDLLGFSEIVQSKSDLLPELFRILDKSNAHKHGSFRVIQFSDTLLVYNEPELKTEHDHSYVAMYLCEFAQEIQYMLLGRDVFLRGLITYGQFDDTGPTPNSDYKNVRAFWGKALIKAYRAESGIQAVGLFVDDTAKPHMYIFETHPYDADNGIWFADTATMLRGMFFDGDDFSYAKMDITSSGNEALLAYDFVYLKRLYEHGHDDTLPPRVRAKYLTTWEFYRQKYPGLCRTLEENGFQFEKVIDIDWKPFTDKIGTPDGFFG